MNINTSLKRCDTKQENGIMDHHYLAKEFAERTVRAAKSSRIAVWISIGIGLVAAIAAVMALFK